ncbi:transposase [Streptomyces sp. INA 01156]
MAAGGGGRAPNPDRLQGFLAKAAWDADELRDRVRGFAVAALAADDAVLIADETGDIKKGTRASVWPASTPARPAGSRTPRSASTCPTAPAGTHPDRPRALPRQALGRHHRRA